MAICFYNSHFCISYDTLTSMIIEYTNHLPTSLNLEECSNAIRVYNDNKFLLEYTLDDDSNETQRLEVQFLLYTFAQKMKEKYIGDNTWIPTFTMMTMTNVAPAPDPASLQRDFEQLFNRLCSEYKIIVEIWKCNRDTDAMTHITRIPWPSYVKNEQDRANYRVRQMQLLPHLQNLYAEYALEAKDALDADVG